MLDLFLALEQLVDSYDIVDFAKKIYRARKVTCSHSKLFVNGVPVPIITLVSTDLSFRFQWISGSYFRAEAASLWIRRYAFLRGMGS